MSERPESAHNPEPTPLIKPVASLPQRRELSAALRAGRSPIHLSGLRGSAVVFMLEALRGDLGRPLVVCCPDEEKARDTVSDFKSVSAARVRLFPEKDVFPRRFETRENLLVRGGRCDCLDHILRHQVDVVVTSYLGFLEKTIPVEMLRGFREEIHTGDRLDLDDFRARLAGLGYDYGHSVEEIGQYSVRGSIVDVFDPAWDYPVRIELDDDEVVSLRTFDLDSQQSLTTVPAVTILPGSGIPGGDIDPAPVRERLRELKVDPARIETIIGEITLTRSTYLLRQYAPLLGMNGSLLDFYGTKPVLVFLSSEAYESCLEDIQKEIDILAGQPDGGSPLLDLFEYIHPPGYERNYGMQTVFVWDLPVEREAPVSADDDSTAVGGPKDSADLGSGARAGQPDDDYTAKPFASPYRIHPGEPLLRFQTALHPSIIGKIDTLSKTVRRLRGKGLGVTIFSENEAQRERLADLLDEDEAQVHLPIGWISAGFIWEAAGLAILTDHEIFHRILPRPRRMVKRRRVKGLQQEHLQLGDFIVHVDYGIGRFTGLEKVGVGGRDAECLTLRYHGGDRIFVPLDQMHLVEKYVGKEGVAPAIDKLGSTKWQRTKEKTRKALEDTARELLAFYAAREISRGHAFSLDTQWQKELEAAFPFEETPHQIKAVGEVKLDMEAEQPMDRLVCGDVGFGKTEVAIRAAFKAVNGEKQVAVLVPTTILALQHTQTFQERMEAFPVRVEMLSRFRTAAEQRNVVAGLKDGTVDVVIGTHRLLSKDVKFKNLGLVIVDEEHRFGVKNKEKFKQFKKSVDVLSMTATPIPRTMYMALSGLRRISSIETPPRNRHPVKTEVVPFDEDTIARGINDEIRRGGQVFFVHNRVASIYSMQAFLEKLLPGVTFGVAHGQMSEKELEKNILAFLDRKYDVLVSTMIIESGLDFPNVDTIIVNRADRLGLAQLYQLRGRVGRRERQAYAYLLLPRYMSLNENARKRLQAMEEFEELGSGYRLAMRDLEIRGAGNILGTEQHGHLAAVGFDMYCKMLKSAIEKLKGEAVAETAPSKVEAALQCYLPDWYVEDQDERMVLYKRLAGCSSAGELDAIEAEIRDRFGRLPMEALNLIDVSRVKQAAAGLGIDRVRVGNDSAVLEFQDQRFLSPKQCAILTETFSGRLLFKSGKTFSITLTAGTGPQPGAGAGIDAASSLLGDVKNLLNLAYDSDKKGVRQPTDILDKS